MPEQSDRWMDVPSNLNHTVIAAELGVTVKQLLYGTMGPATCSTPISLDRVGSDQPLVVAVSGKGNPCLVVGTGDDPRTVVKATKIIVICIPTQAS